MKRLIWLAPLLLLSFACTESARTPPASPVTAAPDVKLRAAVDGLARRDKERARDTARHPLETLAFFGLRDDATVVELWPGGGYYTAILAPYLADHGRLTITTFDPNGDPKDDDTVESREILGRLAENPSFFSKVVDQRITPHDLTLGSEGSADFVFTFRNVHNFIDAGYADKVFAAAARVLKPGGVLGVEEHRGRPGMTVKEISNTGYVPEDTVIALAAGAGLQLESRSEVNANPKDTKDYPHGVWSLPPTLAGKDVDRDRFLAVGESDRMTLRFRKPR